MLLVAWVLMICMLSGVGLVALGLAAYILRQIPHAHVITTVLHIAWYKCNKARNVHIWLSL